MPTDGKEDREPSIPDEPDATNHFGRITAEHEPDAGDELYAVILALAEQNPNLNADRLP